MQIAQKDGRLYQQKRVGQHKMAKENVLIFIFLDHRINPGTKQNNFAKELVRGCYLLKMIKNRSLFHSTSGLRFFFVFQRCWCQFEIKTLNRIVTSQNCHPHISSSKTVTDITRL